MAKPANDFFQTLFSGRGRNSRGRFWLTIAFAWAVMIIGGILSAALESIAGEVLAILVIGPIMIAVFWIGVCNSAKRLHDMGRSGWWLVPIFLLLTVLGLPAQVAKMEGDAELAAGAALIFQLIPGLIYLIAFGAIGGTRGPNKYGDPPGHVAHDTAEPAAA